MAKKKKMTTEEVISQENTQAQEGEGAQSPIVETLDTPLYDSVGIGEPEERNPEEEAEASFVQAHSENTEEDDAGIYRIPYSDFIVDPSLSGRDAGNGGQDRSPAHIKKQVASIMREGQIEPCAFRLAEAGEAFNDKYQGEITAKGGEAVLVSGFGRVSCIREILEGGNTFPGGPEVKAVRWVNKNSHQAFITGLHTNLDRQNLSDVQIGKAFIRLMHPTTEDISRGAVRMNGRQIAEQFGVSTGYVSQRVNIVEKLPPIVLEWLNNRQIVVHHALDLMALDEKDLKKEIVKLTVRLEGGKKISGTEGRSRVIGKKTKAKSGKGGAGPTAKKQRSIKEIKEWFNKMAGGADPKSSRGKVFGAITEYISGAIDEGTLTVRVVGAVPEWKKVKATK